MGRFGLKGDVHEDLRRTRAGPIKLDTGAQSRTNLALSLVPMLQSFTGHLQRMADWLEALSITIVAFVKQPETCLSRGTATGRLRVLNRTAWGAKRLL